MHAFLWEVVTYGTWSMPFLFPNLQPNYMPIFNLNNISFLTQFLRFIYFTVRMQIYSVSNCFLHLALVSRKCIPIQNRKKGPQKSVSYLRAAGLYAFSYYVTGTADCFPTIEARCRYWPIARVSENMLWFVWNALTLVPIWMAIHCRLEAHKPRRLCNIFIRRGHWRWTFSGKIFVIELKWF